MDLSVPDFQYVFEDRKRKCLTFLKFFFFLMQDKKLKSQTLSFPILKNSANRQVPIFSWKRDKFQCFCRKWWDLSTFNRAFKHPILISRTKFVKAITNGTKKKELDVSSPDVKK